MHFRFMVCARQSRSGDGIRMVSLPLPREKVTYALKEEIFPVAVSMRFVMRFSIVWPWESVSTRQSVLSRLAAVRQSQREGDGDSEG